MADPADQAQINTDLGLKAALSHRKTELAHIGHCYNCNDPLKEGVYCDSDCREDHESRGRNYAH